MMAAEERRVCLQEIPPYPTPMAIDFNFHMCVLNCDCTEENET